MNSHELDLSVVFVGLTHETEYYNFSLDFIWEDVYYLMNYRVYITPQTKNWEMNLNSLHLELPQQIEAIPSHGFNLRCSRIFRQETLLCLIIMIPSLSICWVQCNSNIHFVSWCCCSFGLEVGFHLPLISMFSFSFGKLYNTH